MATTEAVDLTALVAELRAALGAEHVITHEHQLRTYESDGLLQYAVTPGAVALPGSAEEVQAVVRACHRAGIPWVARGAGSGLSGGALPVADGVLISLTRMRRILAVDLDNQRVVVEPGVTNVAVSDAVGPSHFYPPDPSSQIVCTIGGNVAENSGGAHCFKYGFTTNYVTGLELVLAGRLAGAPRRRAARPGRATTSSAPSSARRARSASRRRSVARRARARVRAHAGRVLRVHRRGRRGRVRRSSRAASSRRRSR